MSSDPFFSGLSPVEVPWRDWRLHVPLRYRDLWSFTIMYRAPARVVRDLVPSNVHPIRFTPSEAIVLLGVNDARDSDIGPYQELWIGFPVTVNRVAVPFLGMRELLKRGGSVFLNELALTTAPATDLGIDIAGYPKHMADVRIEFEGGGATCTWVEDDQKVLSVTLDPVELKTSAKRAHSSLITLKDGFLARSEMISEASGSGKVPASGIALDLGDHPHTAEIRPLLEGKCLGGTIATGRKALLSPPLETWPAKSIPAGWRPPVMVESP